MACVRSWQHAPAGRRRKPVRRTLKLLAKPKPRTPGAKVRTDRTGLFGRQNPSHPSMQAVSIKPAAGACSLGQDAAPENRQSFPRPFRIREDVRKDRVPDHLVFGEAHKGVPPNWAGTPDGACLEPFQSLAKCFGANFSRLFWANARDQAHIAANATGRDDRSRARLIRNVPHGVPLAHDSEKYEAVTDKSCANNGKASHWSDVSLNSPGSTRHPRPDRGQTRNVRRLAEVPGVLRQALEIPDRRVGDQRLQRGGRDRAAFARSLHGRPRRAERRAADRGRHGDRLRAARTAAAWRRCRRPRHRSRPARVFR